ncbi:NAD-dependent epimerase/dehydratase family protein [Planomonospora sp. ID67723]|uniref:NAD-dependent epimerase/dehydratase family protein n=1 Tax=Planomonospora sp. ID67723 TaxID=2738134 RepID=UPI0018C3835E|nr:NAD-dependent epimerase/dehydratase family protein [Planomonospora sp. ID67723]MBG0826377.1 NAD-dependent epimerase/dehydratase family protein [Planomonospora sp. ID67723]
MRILIIGGTRFVGRHITEAALAAGHEVSLLHRGRTGPGLFPEAEHLIADRDTGLPVLRGREWDVTIDVSAYLPSQVETLADAVATGRYVFVSTTAVYAAPGAPGFTEDSPLHETGGPVPGTVTGATYGPLKVLCERTAVERFGPGTLVVRPTYVIGPYDYTGRFTYWVNRIARGGEVLAPGDPSAPIQVIDGRDMASWIVAMTEKADGGTFHAVSPRPPFTFGDMLEAIAAEVAPPGTTLTWAAGDFLRAEGQNGRSLPLWGEDGESTAINTADPSAAYAAGLAPRPLAQSIREIRASEADFSVETTITPEREAEILAAWHAR